jgi:primosomal protein N' (replication factor Y) (superfamily II helicase)
VRVRFHGRLVRGWVLGPTDDVPDRLLPVSGVVSPVRWFDDPILALCRWVSERYVAPLATVLGRATPPRVASEEREPAVPLRPATSAIPAPGAVAGYRGGEQLLESIRRPDDRAWVLRPAPEEETAVAVDAVASCVEAGRRAIVLVPEAAPVPGVARAVASAFGDRCGSLVGGSKRARFRTWLDARAGAFDVVVGTRPTVFAPLLDVGLLFVSRESHPALREDRAPYYHVRDVAIARGRIQGATVVLSAICPSIESSSMQLPEVRPARRRWPPVEVVNPGPEGRAPRLVRALRGVGRGFIYSPLPGYGVAAVCRSCGRPAACAVCGGMLRSEEGTVRCVVCEAPGRCRHCGGTGFGMRRGGRERVEEWASRVSAVPVHRLGAGDTPRLPGDAEILVGGPDDVRDLGPADLDLVAILDADLASRRPGLSARERAVTTWMEAVGWARPRGGAIVQGSNASDPAVQALVRGNPDRFHEDEAARRTQAGFPVGAAVFRVAGSAELEARLRATEPLTLLTASGEGPSGQGATVCLLALETGKVAAFGREMRDLAAEGIVSRVEAEPHL